MSRPVGSLVTTVVPLALAACSYAGLLRPSVLKQVTAPVAGVTTIIAAPTSYAFEATPIVVDGVMFVSGFDSYVWALDATSGRLLWSYHHAVPLDTPLCCGNVNRGIERRSMPPRAARSGTCRSPTSAAASARPRRRWW